MPDTVVTRIEFEGLFGNLHHGSCNGCNRWSSPEGMIPHTVASIQLGGLEFRLCASCLRVMRDVLKQAKEAMDK